MEAEQYCVGEPLVRVEHLTRVIVTRAQRTVVLDDVTFSVPARSLFAINGPSGSGKSTVLNMLTGLDRPTSGSVIFGGQTLRAQTENELARWRGHHVGIVFQFFQLIPTLTAAENVMLALQLGGGRRQALHAPSREWREYIVDWRHSVQDWRIIAAEVRGRAQGRLEQAQRWLDRTPQWRERAQECLELVDVGAYADRLPSELSGGQQQRVAIARALANDPPVLVADEPTGNLDSHAAHAVFDTLAGLTERGKTVIYVTHDPRLAERSSAGIALLDGSIVDAHGTEATITGEPESLVELSAGVA